MSLSFTVASWMNKLLKSSVNHYCQFETANDPFTMVTREGGLMTAYEIKGTFGIMGPDATRAHIDSLVDSLSSALKRPGHRLQFVFRRDPLNSKQALRKSIQGAIRTLATLNMDLEQMVQERSDKLEKKTVLETCFLVITTSERALHPDILAGSKKERAEKAKRNGNLKPGEFGQSLNVEVPGIDMVHTGFVNQIISRLEEKLSLRKMKTHEFLHQIRRQITQYDTSDSWRPYLPGDRMAARLEQDTPVETDMSHIMFPDVGQQLFSREPKIAAEDNTLVDLGDWKIAPIMVDQRPQDAKPFAELFSSIDRNVPYQMSLVIDSGHDRVCQLLSRRKTFASFIAFISSENKLIRESAEELLETAIESTMVSAQITFSTWGRDIEEVRRNRSKLKTAVESWGQTQVVEERGDAIEAWFNTLPGFSAEHLATRIPLEVLEALVMSPITRPVSPWSDGTMLYRTIDEKLFPFLPGSDLQTANMEVVFAPPGFGKSFYLAASNMGLITRPGNEVLPRIGILDIGFSSAMFVELVKDSLPPHLKHLAQAFRLEMTRDYAVNFFDTPLGCQKPLSVDREYVVNMMTLLTTPAGRKEPVDRMPELISSLVDAMYDYFSEDKYPQPYEAGMDELIDEALRNNNIRLMGGESWWKVSRLLFDEGLFNDASQAQRYAVPTLNDATTVLSQETTIRDVFGSSMVGDETLINYLKVMIISAVNDYPILSQPTVFSIGEARIISIDLMSVAKDGSAQAEKRTAVMYLLGRQIICKDYYRKAEFTLPEIPHHFRDYHRRVIEKDESVPKKLCMDEFHRTTAVPMIRKQAIVDIREGRKYDVHVTLLSQLLSDFPEDLIQLINNTIILSKGIAETTLDEIKARFRPSNDAIKHMNRWLTGPGVEGSSMLYLGALKSETAPRIEQVLRLTLGGSEIWAYTTVPQDVSLRRRLTFKIGLNNALKVLTAAYPNGSAKADIQQIMSENSLDVVDFEEDQTIFDVLVVRLMKDYRELIDAAKMPVVK
ncbi:ATP-binding protein [Pseudomonas sp. Leaf58]|uniref:ATP-binding protein n=1 Tax=Pseudomonas sp. Leaf58 TaxID=1736226 RepID=UPI0009E996E5|nr:ATP-binding protein [Pseudomonas sp. Leaf58]